LAGDRVAICLTPSPTKFAGGETWNYPLLLAAAFTKIGFPPSELFVIKAPRKYENKGFIMSLIWNRTHAWDDADWRAQAACRDTEPELFFPVGTTGMATDQIESAKRVCDHCDAQKACLEFALATNQESGVWGGTTEDERRKLRKQWLAARRRSAAV
jgi:WhiB family redox-sensing transcriptional regulator